MHDFCFTLPYGALLILGGLFGYLRKGSIPSLAGGAGSGALLCLAGYIQLQYFHQGKNSSLAELLQLGELTNRLRRTFSYRATVYTIPAPTFMLVAWEPVLLFSNAGLRCMRQNVHASSSCTHI